MTDPIEPRLTRGLTATITGHRTRRIDLPTLREWAHDIDPTLTGDPSSRQRLLTALTTLQAEGAVTFPSPTNRTAWDRRAHPPLPAWITRTPTPQPPVQKIAEPRVWPHTLAAAAKLATRPNELALLTTIATWLRDHPTPIVVPVEERSLQLFNDEKALSKLATTRLFTTGALTLALLACHPTPLPLASTYIPGTGPTTLLIVENNATYFSFIYTARTLPSTTRASLHIAWGSGGQITASIASATVLDPPPTTIRYFGDLDPAGLHIPANAHTTATEHQLPPVQPATDLYQWLLDHGIPRPGPAATTTRLPPPVVDWLTEPLRDPVQRLIAAGHRIPQETLGLEVLLTNPQLLRSVTT
jgi:hypothetical protein